MRIIGVQELLLVRDCVNPDCPKEAEKGMELCRKCIKNGVDPKLAKAKLAHRQALGKVPGGVVGIRM